MTWSICSGDKILKASQNKEVSYTGRSPCSMDQLQDRCRASLLFNIEAHPNQHDASDATE